MKLFVCSYVSLFVFLQVLFQRFVDISAIFRHTYVDIIPNGGLSMPAYRRHVLTCKASYRGEAPDVEWFKDSRIRLEGNPRFGITMTFDQYDIVVTSRLTFFNPLPSDSGMYSCAMVSSASGVAEVPVKFWSDDLAIDPSTDILTAESTCESEQGACQEKNETPSFVKTRRSVKSAPVLIPSSDVTVKPGGEHTISCNIQGGFDGTMLWSKDGRYIGSGGSFDTDGDRKPNVRILPQSRSLSILDGTAQDAGVYSCRFRYNLGRQWKSLGGSVNVFAGVDLKSDSYILWQGNQTTPLKVKCLATGYPLPTVSWSYTPKKIDLRTGAWNGDISIEEMQINKVVRQSTLKIAQMPGFFNITKFNCKGENRISTKSNTIMVVNVGTTLIPGSKASSAPSSSALLLILMTISSELLRRNMR